MMTGAKVKSSSSDSKRPPLSCAECRRLKLKCNRTWPCLSCQKRGVADICPEGSLATRPRHRPAPPTPQHVLQRIYELQKRINELETALSALQATVSPEPHPLLKRNSQTYLQKKLMRKSVVENTQILEDFSLATPTETSDESRGTEEPEPEEPEEIIESVGTLSITPDGKSRFFGPTAVSEGLSIDQEITPSTKPTNVTLPIDIAALVQYFPFAALSDAVEALHERVKSYLPPLDRANTLCASYFTYASFVANIVPQDELFESLFLRLYGTGRSSDQFPNHHARQMPHGQWPVPAEEFSVFFSVLALGALTDPSTEPFSTEAETYYQLSRALLTRDNVLSEPTLASVQTLFLGSYYEGMQSQSSSSRDCWIAMVAASKTAQIMGLHRNHSVFGLDPQDANRRRVIFWATYSLDLIQSLALGRPLSTSIAHMDTQVPADIPPSAIESTTGAVEESFYQWKYRFCAEVVSVVSDHVLRVKPPSYASALEADHTLRQFVTTFGRGLPKVGNWAHPTTAAQYQMMIGTRETCMLYIHRRFFAHVMSTHPVDPEKTKYGKSVTTAYESACRIVEGMQIFARHHPEFAARVWFLWNHVLSASFILGSIVAHAPGCALAPPASAQLDVIYEILKQESVYRGRAEYMLSLIIKLRIKGYNARMRYQGGFMVNPRAHPSPAAPDDDHDELAVIGGKARIVLSSPSRHTSLSPPQPPPQMVDASPNPENYQVQDLFSQQQQQQQHQNMYPVYSSQQAQDTTWAQHVLELADPAPPPFMFADPPGSFSQHTPLQGEYSTPSPPGVHSHSPWSGVSDALWQTLVRDLSGGDTMRANF